MNHPHSRRSFLYGLGAAALSRPGAGLLAAEPQRAVIAGDITLCGVRVAISVAPVTEHTLRISVIPTSSGGEAAEAFAGDGLRDGLREDAGGRRFSSVPVGRQTCGRFEVQFTHDPLALEVSEEGASRQKLQFDVDNGRVRFELHGPPVFGLGEGGRQFDRRGVVDAMRNGQFKPDQFLNGGRSPIPWLISPAGWGLFFHHPMGTFDLTGEQGVFRPSFEPEAQDIFLVLHPDPKIILREFANLSGFPHLPPIWAFGYQQSHRTLASREAVLDEVRTFREKKLPCDVMIYLGTGFAPSGWNTGHASFAFNPKIFPDPEKIFVQMHDEHMRVVLHVLGVPFDFHGRVGEKSANPDSAARYWADHLGVFRNGVDGWWVDDGDELLPQARLDRNRMYWEGPLQERPNVRPFSIQRNGYAGLQQFGFLWSGDINSSWDALRTQIANGLNTGVSGIPYWGTDTGGFFSTKELTAELYVRWFQYSAFCPLFRSHGRTWMLRLPWGWDRGDVGPVEDDPSVLPKPEDLHNAQVEDICRKFLELRYRLLPYIYSTAREAHETGMPLMRALWLSFPNDARAASVADAYMWGASLLVAPVTSPAAKVRPLYLPAGEWFDFETAERIAGGQDHSASVDLESMPLYVKAGSILPLGSVKQFALERSESPLEVRIYPGSDASFDLYEDDGVSMDHTRGVFSSIQMRWDDRSRQLSLRLGGGSMHAFTTRRMQVKVVGSDGGKLVAFTGTPINVRL